MSQSNELLIIIADDDPDDIDFLIAALKDIGTKSHVIYVKNGMELLNLLLQQGDTRLSGLNPDFIILDVNMHIMDGLTALETISQHPELRKLPVYVLSTSVHPEYIERANRLGAKKYYEKPSNFQDLKLLMQEMTHNCLSA
jgi:CheY-like chemotaxis protein